MEMPENMDMILRAFQLNVANQDLFCLNGPLHLFLDNICEEGLAWHVLSGLPKEYLSTVGGYDSWSLERGIRNSLRRYVPPQTPSI